MRSKRSAPSWLPSREEIERECERRYAAALRDYLASLGRPEWPAWPPEHDAGYHAWVREHWSEEASDRYDVFMTILDDLEPARLRVLAQDLVDLGADGEAARERLAADGHPVWDEDCGDWQTWIDAHWPAGRAAALRRALDGAERSLEWVGDHRERLRASDRAAVARLEGLLRFDLGEEEMRPYLERRACGIRGRYRVLHTVWEHERGITEADVDAP